MSDANDAAGPPPAESRAPAGTASASAEAEDNVGGDAGETCPERVAAPVAAPAPAMSWAQRASKNQVADQLGGYAAPPLSACPQEVREPDAFVDFLSWLSAAKRSDVDGDGEAARPPSVPDRFRKFAELSLVGVPNMTKVTHSRLGLRNDANTCYVNVIVQSLLPCSALMWFLRRCGEKDPKRPFLSCLVSLCKEFHTRKPDTNGDVFNVMLLPQVKNVVVTWQKFGAQQDAGEFLLYILNGMHEESKWQSATAEPTAVMSGGDEDVGEGDAEGGGWAQLVKSSRRPVESREAGIHEASPITRIFGGLLSSAVRSRGVKADSVSLEPFNRLDLDISAPGVRDVRSALDAFFRPEAINDGQATRRLQIKELPKVLVLSLKRFTFSRVNGGPQKVKKQIRYDQRLTFDRSWFLDATSPPPEYLVHAVICHHGESVNGGHYTAIVRYNDEWYLYDDTSVRRIEAREVAAQQFEVYLLIYIARTTVDLSP